MKIIEFETISEDFDFLESWEDKYRYIIDLGKDLEIYPKEFKNEDYRVCNIESSTRASLGVQRVRSG